MSTLFVDYTNGSLGNKSVKYHGGGDFTRFILNQINQYDQEEDARIKIVVIWPKNRKILTSEDRDIYNSFNICEVNSLLSINFQKDDILLLPLLDSYNISIVKHLKKQYRGIKIYGVLHGLRLLDMTKYDKYDQYYYSGIKSFQLILWVRRWIAAGIAKCKLRENLPLLDRVYTVSNNSMQLINQHGNTKYIKYFTRFVTNYDMDNDTHANHDDASDKYILFVNSNRYEKNFIRSLVAFCKYQEKNNTDLYLYVLGMSNELRTKLYSIPEINNDIVNKRVRFFDYVSSEELIELYSKCQFLLYTSKSEGFGLPPLEALNVGRPSVCSRNTSVPEVLGMCAYYVNPYDIDDICKGIEYMSKKNNQERFIKIIKELKPLLYQQGTLNMKILISEMLSE